MKTPPSIRKTTKSPPYEAEKTLARLTGIIRGLGSAVVAFSGGVDSSLLLKGVSLSGIRALAVTASSASMPPDDMKDALRMAELIGVEHRVIRTEELKNELYAANPPERCFYCKEELFSRLKGIAQTGGFDFVIDGATADDLRDYRPGAGAARLFGVRSPLMEAGLGKKQVRELSRWLGLPTWDKPASPCLSSRIPHGMPITKDALRRVALSEEALRGLGFRELRVRHHNELARVEIPLAELDRALAMRQRIVDALRRHFRFVCLDLEGFRSGSLNPENKNNKNTLSQ